MATHTLSNVVLYQPGNGPVAGVENGTLAPLEDIIRAAVRNSGLLAEGVVVLENGEQPPN